MLVIGSGGPRQPIDVHTLTNGHYTPFTPNLPITKPQDRHQLMFRALLW
jgi:hypothetical protein